jgi:hypothetical protein
MIKQLQKVGNSRGIILDRPILDLLKIDDNTSFEISQEKGGLLLRPISIDKAYKIISKRHRKSLQKLAH